MTDRHEGGEDSSALVAVDQRTVLSWVPSSSARLCGRMATGASTGV